MTAHVTCPVCKQKVRVSEDRLIQHYSGFHRCKGSLELVETIRRYEESRKQVQS